MGVVVGSWLTARRMPNAFLASTQDFAANTREQFQKKIDSTPAGSEIFIENADFPPVKLVLRIAGKSFRFPGTAGYFAILYDSNTVRGRTVRFVGRDEKLVRAVREGPSRRMGELLVTEKEAVGAPGK